MTKHLILTCLLAAFPLLAQPTTVSVVDTLYSPDGSNWKGTVAYEPSSPACKLVRSGKAYGLSKRTICLGVVDRTCDDTVAAGVINIALVPTVGSTPEGCSYSAWMTPQKGEESREYWEIPATGPVTLADIRRSEPPTPTTKILWSQIDWSGFGNGCLEVSNGTATPITCGSGGGGSGATWATISTTWGASTATWATI